MAYVDMGRGAVLEVVDIGVVPFPPQGGSYYPEDNGPLRTDLRPLAIAQPEGVSFTVDGNLVSWQKWSLRVGMDPLEGLVLHTVGYDDGGGVRPLLFRASVSEMVVPYGDPGPMHSWKSAFDAGEWGLGRMANSLTLGCDCLGEITYFDDVFSDERGHPHTRPNAICIHEEDYGILWKHVDMTSGRTEVRRSRRLVVSSIATVGNYEYGFYWYFYLDGSMQFEVKLTGIMSTMGVADGVGDAHASMVAPASPRPTTSTCSTSASTWRSTARTTPSSKSTRCARRSATTIRGAMPSPRWPPCWRRSWRPAATSTLHGAEFVEDRQSIEGQHGGTAHRLQAGPDVDADVAGRSVVERWSARHVRRAQFWVTPFAEEERRAAGDYPNQHSGGAGLPAGRRRTARSWTPTSCSGTRSVSPTSHAPRIGPSCRSSTPDSALSPLASSTATPLSTCRRRRTGRVTAMATEQGGDRTGRHSPQEFHPPVEEYLETMLALAEEGVPVIQARIAERLGAPPRRSPRCSNG